MIILILFTFIILRPYIVDAAPLKTGDPAPDFTLKALTGEKVRLSDLRGSIVVLGLFHICEPCKQQAEILQKLYQKNQARGVKMIGINASGDSRGDVEAYLKSFDTKVTFPYLLDPEMMVDSLYTVRATPSVYVLDRKGAIAYKGAFTQQEALEKVIASLD
jgi:cytochrome c biogenesis protein CcmG/thiol:disulfide interchange protein DsbE